MNEIKAVKTSKGILSNTLYNLDVELNRTTDKINEIINIILGCQPVECCQGEKLANITVQLRLLNCIDLEVDNNKKLDMLIDVLGEQFGDDLKLV